MKKAIVYYHSKTGITNSFGHNINEYLKSIQAESTIKSIHDFDKDELEGVDYIFLGCWTHGLFVVLQHPDKTWVEFARGLPDLKGKKIILFTTYKLATGSMFRKMKKVLKGKINSVSLELKSKNDRLTDVHKSQINETINME